MRSARARSTVDRENHTPVVDAVVIGGGLSGLVCARAIAAAGARVVVLEARDRLGGRIHSLPLAGVDVDVGAQWIAPGQPRITRLAAELGLPIEPQVRAGRALVVRGPDRDLLSRVPLAAAVDLTVHSRALERLEARATADVSVADWLDAHVRTARARDLLAAIARVKLGCEPEQVSARALADHLTGSDGLLGAIDPAAGAVEHRIAGGAGRLIAALGDRLGDAIRLSAPVSALAIDAGGVSVSTPALELRARSAVLALAPALAARIAGPVAEQLREAAAAAVGGAVIKVVLAYRHPFWRDARLSGESLAATGVVSATADVSVAGQPALAALCAGGAARALADLAPADRLGRVTAALAAMFGPAAAAPTAWVEGNWPRDPLSPGCVVSVAPGHWQPAGALRLPPRLHAAGTECAPRWAGYMEGAVIAGERAAAAVLADLAPVNADA